MSASAWQQRAGAVATLAVAPLLPARIPAVESISWSGRTKVVIESTMTSSPGQTVNVFVTGRVEYLDHLLARAIDARHVAETRTRKDTMMSRLTAIAELRDGWAGPGSEAIARDVVTALEQVIPRVADVPREYGARADGSVAFEWREERKSFTALLEGAGPEMFLLADEGGEDFAEAEGAFDLDAFVRFVRTGIVDA